jgi:predicted peptidase
MWRQLRLNLHQSCVIAMLSSGACLIGPASSVADDPSLKGYQEKTISATIGGRAEQPVKFLLLAPAKIEPGKKYPVILFLHGAGERGNDNRAQLMHFPEKMSQTDRREQFPAFVIAPQCPAGKRWVEVNWNAKQSTAQTPEPTEPMQAAIAALQHVLKTEPADASRVYLMGLSMGGYGTWDLAMRHPEWFAAIAPICGGGDERQAAKLKDTPVWVFHGDKDTVVPVARSRTMVEAIRAAGGQPKYSELPGVGHNSWQHACDDKSGLLEWMFQQSRAP